MRKVFSTLLVAFSLLLGGHVAQAQGGTTQYIYEANGRLSAVIAPSGAAAIYRYDAAGNLTGIDQISAGDLSILSFSPSLGTIGDQVVLVGTGLDTVGTVSFNGIPSQIISASASSLSTTVPVGASSGPITVSGARGTFVSATSFAVVARVDVSPAESAILPGESVQFQAVVVGTPNQAVAWLVNGIANGNSSIGTIDANGVYLAPIINTGLTVAVGAASETDSGVIGLAAVRILNPNTTSEVRSPGLMVTRGVAANSQAFAMPISVARSTFTNDYVASTSVAVEKGNSAATVARVVSVGFGVSVPLFSLPVSASTGPVISSVSPATLAKGVSTVVTVTGSNFNGVTGVLFLSSATGAGDGSIAASSISSSPDGHTLTFTATVAAGAVTGARVVQVVTPNGATSIINSGNNVVQVQ